MLELDDLVVGALDELGKDGRRVEVAFSDASPSVRVDAQGRVVGINSYLIGESLMRADDVETATHALLSEARP